jgi:hypothetical protein
MIMAQAVEEFSKQVGGKKSLAIEAYARYCEEQHTKTNTRKGFFEMKRFYIPSIIHPHCLLNMLLF